MEEKNEIKLTSIEKCWREVSIHSSFGPIIIGTGEYIKELNSIFYGFLLKLTLSEKKMLFVYFYKHMKQHQQKEGKKRNNKKFHNIPIALWMAKYISIMHKHTHKTLPHSLKRNHGMMGRKTGFGKE